MNVNDEQSQEILWATLMALMEQNPKGPTLFAQLCGDYTSIAATRPVIDQVIEALTGKQLCGIIRLAEELVSEPLGAGVLRPDVDDREDEVLRRLEAGDF